MSLTLVVGRPNSGKTGTLWEVVRHSVAEGLSPVVVLPSRPDADSVAREFARSGPKLGVTTRVLDDYIDGLWGAHGDGRRIAGHFERSLALARASRSCQLVELERSAQGSGFVGLLEPLAAAGVDGVVPPRAQSPLAREIADVLVAYRDVMLEAGMIERADAVRVLDALAEPAWFTGPIVAHRFSDLTPLQERFLAGAANHTDVWLALPWQQTLAATRALDPLVERLVGRGAAVVQPGAEGIHPVRRAPICRGKRLRSTGGHPGHTPMW